MRRRLPTVLAMAMAAIAMPPGQAMAAAPPPSGGTISIEPKTADGDYDPATPVFVNAMIAALESRGFTILDDVGHAAYVGELILSRAQVGTGLGRAPAGSARVAPGGAPGVGAGVAIPLSTGNSEVVPIYRTRIELRIRQRGQNDVIWDGAALTVREAGSRRAANDAVATALSGALLNSYPAQLPDDIGVP